MTLARPGILSRYLVSAQLRPIRLVVVLPHPASTRAFRRTVARLCSIWGGADSLIVTGTTQRSIDDKWLRMLRAFDPDAVLIPRMRSGPNTRRGLGAYMDVNGISPRWITGWLEPPFLEPGWTLPTVPPIPDEGSGSAGALPGFRGTPTPLLTALTGLVQQRPALGSDRRLTASDWESSAAFSSSTVRGSATSVASLHNPAFVGRPAPVNPYYVYAEDTLDAALWLWAMRGLRGSFRIYSAARFEEALPRLTKIPRPTPTRVVVCGRLPRNLQKTLASIDAFSLVSVEDYAPVRRLQALGGPAQEEMTEVNGELSVPATTSPELSSLSTQFPELGRFDAYALDVSIQSYTGRVGLPVGYPGRLRMNDLVHAQPSLIMRARPETAVRSRIRRAGSTTLFLRGSQSVTRARVRLVELSAVFSAIDPAATYRLSDKGTYARWMLEHVGSLETLQGLLVDLRSRVLLEQFRKHHAGRKLTASYRRFMTWNDMRSAWRTLRAAGRLPKRIKGQLPDELWLREWLSEQVSAGVLRQGMLSICSECRQDALMPFGSFSAVFTCPRCGSAQATPGVPSTGYWLAEVAHLFLTANGDVTVRAVAGLVRRSSQTVNYDFDHNVVRPGESRELDLLAVVDGTPAIGEAKTDGAFDDEDMSFLERTAKRTRAGAIVLAVDRDCEGGCTDTCVSDAATGLKGTRDTALPPDGPRTRLDDLRSRLGARGPRVIVMCKRELSEPLTGAA